MKSGKQFNSFRALLEAYLIEKIVQRGSKWVIMSKDGSKQLGEYDTKEDALKRLRQIEYFKNN